MNFLQESLFREISEGEEQKNLFEKFDFSSIEKNSNLNVWKFSTKQVKNLGVSIENESSGLIKALKRDVDWWKRNFDFFKRKFARNCFVSFDELNRFRSLLDKKRRRENYE